MTETPDLPQVIPSEYRVIPTGYADSILVDKFHFEISVVWRGTDPEGEDRWAVLHHGRCLNAEGEWEYESSPTNRTDEFKARTRFNREEAIRRAVAVVDDLPSNGRTFGQWNEYYQSQSQSQSQDGV